MPADTSIHAIYNVETDATDWPKGLPVAERPVLVEHVNRALRERGPLPLFELYRAVTFYTERDERTPYFRKAALFDFLYACVERAARAASAAQVWKLERAPGDLAQATRALLSALDYEGKATGRRRTDAKHATAAAIEAVQRELARVEGRASGDPKALVNVLAEKRPEYVALGGAGCNWMIYCDGEPMRGEVFSTRDLANARIAKLQARGPVTADALDPALADQHRPRSGRARSLVSGAER